MEEPSSPEVSTPSSSMERPAREVSSATTEASHCFCAESSTQPPGEIPLKRATPPIHAALSLEGVNLDESTFVTSPALPYALMLASILERRSIDRDELIAALRATVRQRSIGRQPLREYALRYLTEHPP
jgi:hypothetical protein